MQENTENKKIKNATEIEYMGIIFRSVLERDIYKYLVEHNYSVQHEPVKFVIWEGHKPKIPVFERFKDRKAHRRIWGRHSYKMLDITYTPDFILNYNDKIFVIEAKGYENDVFPYKKKLFIEYLEKHHPDYTFMEIFSLKELKEALKIIENEKETE